MAIRYAVATGNWSSTATWDGGTLPTSADDVYANNRTVTIDQNITVISLRNSAVASPAITAGGSFQTQTSGTRTISANIIAFGTTVLNVQGTCNCILTGNVTGGSSGSNYPAVIAANYGSLGGSLSSYPTLTINGNITGGSVSGGIGVRLWGGTMTINGSITGGTASTNASGADFFNSDNQPAAITINTGPITGGSSSSGSTSGLFIQTSPTGTSLTNSFVNINCAVNAGINSGTNYGISAPSLIPLTITGVCTGLNGGAAVNQTASTTGSILTINGNITATNGTAVLASALTVNITGTLTGGAGTNTGAINYSGIGVCTITGDVYGSTTNINGRGIYTGFNTPGSMVVNGNVYAQNGIGITNTGNGPITINGNVFGGTASSSFGINPTIALGNWTINGNVTGGSGSSAYGVYHNSTGTVTINGSAIAGTGNASHGAFNNITGTLIVTKAVGNGYGVGSVGISGGTFGVVSNANNSVTRVKQIELGSLGAFPVNGAVRFIDDTTNQVTAPLSTGGTKTLVDPNATGLMPAVSNVRLGTTYSSGNLTGTMAVPAANSVAAGVAVDNTVGTAVLTQANVWDYSLSSASSVAGSVGEKLKKTAIPADIIALS